MSNSRITIDCEIELKNEEDNQFFVVTIEVSGLGEGTGTLITQYFFDVDTDLDEMQARELIHRAFAKLRSQMDIVQSRLGTFDPAMCLRTLDLTKNI